MSDWTYIQGSVSLSTNPFRFKKNKDGSYKVDKKKHDYRFYEGRYLPFGDAQIKFGFPRIGKAYKKGKEVGTIMQYEVYTTSYPIIEAKVAEAIKSMPQGETGLFYMLKQNPSYLSSSSDNSSIDVENRFYAHIKKVNEENIWSDISRKELNKYFPSEIIDVHYNSESVLAIHDSVRWCTADRMYTALIKFINDLLKDNIIVENGIFTFNDGFDSYTVSIRNRNITVNIFSYKEEARTEYWQVFYKRHFIYDNEIELKKVPSFAKKINDLSDTSAAEREFAEYKAKYELKVG